jgi:oligopeptide transport system permease protein
VYQDYVRVGPSLTAHPTADQIPVALNKVASRVRAKVDIVSTTEASITLVLTADRPIDERGLVYFERSDVFGRAEIKARRDDGRRLELEVPIKRQRFLFGTDGNGRDLLTRWQRRSRWLLACCMARRRVISAGAQTTS